ncbi:MAG: DUF1553 domain-containing protein [Planctomycetes bacterium]|nr:DUF1553 domain-containing protein [Planctomycetota bacterium]
MTVRFRGALLLAAGFVALSLTTVADEPAEYEVTDADREHWSFRPIARPAVPPVINRDWVRTPIDAFILAKLEQTDWQPNPPAAQRDLLRRTFLDLTGLPPTIDEQDQLIADDSPTAFERLIDDLLSRPSYGERWGRHWLDLVRYAETNGYERDGAKPSVWRYRDYVIDAFNADKTYDRFIVEQFAGDELPDASTETVIATGFHRLGPFDDEPADFEQDRYDQLDDIIRTTSQAFLGITLGCARCHNHKFDPLTNHDYYRVAAVLNTLKRPQNGRTELDLPAGTLTQRAALMQRDRRIDENRKQIIEIRDSIRSDFLASGKSALLPDAVDAFGIEPDQRTPAQKELVIRHAPQLEAELLAALPVEKRQRINDLEQRIVSLRAATPDLPRGYFMTESSDPPPKSFLLLRGQASARGPELQPAVPVVLTRQPITLSKQPTTQGTSGRRLEFARWMANADNPLTARVIVNRVWQYHFGEGLVRTSSDFGIIGEAPTHPELLDWLAHWFSHDANWSIKKLHRLILSSSTYQMSKADHPTYGERDPRNTKFWRFPYRRLEVEVIRDSMLSASGQLRRTMGGPGVYLEIPPEVLAGNSDPNVVWPKFDEVASSRRTVYAFVKRALVVPFLEVLDVCDTTRSTELRNRTTISTQALTLFNGDFVNRQARHFAERLQREAGNEPIRQIELAYRLTLGRAAAPSELATMQRFLADATKSEDHRLALEQLCRVILNLNELVYSN